MVLYTYIYIYTNIHLYIVVTMQSVLIPVYFYRDRYRTLERFYWKTNVNRGNEDTVKKSPW